MDEALVSELLTQCPLCHDEFEDPRLLQCMHAFCLKCLRGCDLTNSPPDVQCPQCMFVTTCCGPLERLPRHYYASDCIRLRKGKRSCENCEAVDATVFCKQCASKLCQDCSRSIHSNPIFKRHQVLSCASSGSGGGMSRKGSVAATTAAIVGEEDEGALSAAVVESGVVSATTSPAAQPLQQHPSSPSAAQAVINCVKHVVEPLTLFCVDCRACLCRFCATDTEHNGHRITHDLPSRGREIVSRDIPSLQRQLDRVVLRSQAAAERIHVCLERDLRGNYAAAVALIDSRFDVLLAALQERRMQLKRETQKIFDEKAEKLSSQERVLRNAARGAQAALVHSTVLVLSSNSAASNITTSAKQDHTITSAHSVDATNPTAALAAVPSPPQHSHPVAASIAAVFKKAEARADEVALLLQKREGRRQSVRRPLVHGGMGEGTVGVGGHDMAAAVAATPKDNDATETPPSTTDAFIPGARKKSISRAGEQNGGGAVTSSSVGASDLFPSCASSSVQCDVGGQCRELERYLCAVQGSSAPCVDLGLFVDFSGLVGITTCTTTNPPVLPPSNDVGDKPQEDIVPVVSTAPTVTSSAATMTAGWLAADIVLQQLRSHAIGRVVYKQIQALTFALPSVQDLLEARHRAMNPNNTSHPTSPSTLALEGGDDGTTIAATTPAATDGSNKYAYHRTSSSSPVQRGLGGGGGSVPVADMLLPEGIMHHLACGGGQHLYANPSLAGAITLYCSVPMGYGRIENLVGPGPANFCTAQVAVTYGRGGGSGGPRASSASATRITPTASTAGGCGGLDDRPFIEICFDPAGAVVQLTGIGFHHDAYCPDGHFLREWEVLGLPVSKRYAEHAGASAGASNTTASGGGGGGGRGKKGEGNAGSAWVPLDRLDQTTHLSRSKPWHIWPLLQAPIYGCGDRPSTTQPPNNSPEGGNDESTATTATTTPCEVTAKGASGVSTSPPPPPPAVLTLRALRIRQTSPNSSGTWQMLLSGIELYGTLLPVDRATAVYR